MLFIRKMEADEKRANLAQQREYGTNCGDLDMPIKETGEIAEDVGFDNVDPMGITELLESHSQPLSNEEIYELDQQLTEQQKEDENVQDRGIKCNADEGLAVIPSAIDIAA